MLFNFTDITNLDHKLYTFLILLGSTSIKLLNQSKNMIETVKILPRMVYQFHNGM